MSSTAVDRNGLRGWNVVVTRPREQSERLCRLIETAGGHAVRLPLLAIEPSGDPAAALAVLRGLAQCDWLIFISTNAVHHATRLDPGWPHRSRRIRVAAIGGGTAAALQACGVGVDLQPKAQFNSEALLAAPEFAAVARQRIVIVRGQGGRETLTEVLRARGALVEHAEVYRRVPVHGDLSSLLAVWRTGGIDAVTLTSGEALQQLARRLGRDHADLLAATPLAVIGERVADLARGMGCQRLAVAAEASDEGLRDALIGLARTEQA